MSKTFIDQMGRSMELLHPPKRIISIVPSQTELLFHLGLDKEVVGLTKFCIHPEDKWQSKPRIGGTKKLHFDKIAELRPDLIIGNKEENQRDQIEELEKHYPVWMSDIVSIEDAFGMMKAIGGITGKENASNELVTTLRHQFAQLQKSESRLSIAYLIWRQPWMAVGKGTFIHEMINLAGFKNVFSDKTRYPEITLKELSAAKPDVVMLSSEPYPFKEKHIEEIKKHCQPTVVKLVDGELFSWYGSRMLKAAPYFAILRSEINSALKN